MATVINESNDGADHSFVSAEPLDDRGHHGLVGGRVQPDHLARGQTDLATILTNNHFEVHCSRML